MDEGDKTGVNASRLKTAGDAGAGSRERGGSYFNNNRNVRCAYRNRNNNDNFNNNTGFRVVLRARFSVKRIQKCYAGVSSHDALA